MKYFSPSGLYRLKNVMSDVSRGLSLTVYNNATRDGAAAHRSTLKVGGDLMDAKCDPSRGGEKVCKLKDLLNRKAVC